MSKFFTTLSLFSFICVGYSAMASNIVECSGQYHEQDSESLRSIHLVFEPKIGGSILLEDFASRDFSNPELGNFRETNIVESITPVTKGLKVSYVRKGTADGAEWTITDWFTISTDFTTAEISPNAAEAKLQCIQK
jgi:hypothetical protein